MIEKCENEFISDGDGEQILWKKVKFTSNDRNGFDYCFLRSLKQESNKCNLICLSLFPTIF